MADSLVLKGVKDVRKHKGSEMLLMRPKRGGDTHQIKRWWAPGTKSTVYAACSLFKVTQGTAVVYLAIDTNEMSAIRVDLDTNFEFKFFGIAQIERAALFDEQMNLIEHYLFPKISGGKIVTVTPPSAASRPGTGGDGGGGTTDPDPDPELTIEEKAAAADYTYVVTENGGIYELGGVAQATVNMSAGETVYFNLSDASLSGHPFAIYTDSSKTTVVTVGVETSDDGTILLFTPPIAGSFSYQCTQHAAMGGDIIVS